MRHSVMIFVLNENQLIQLVDNYRQVKIMTINELHILVSGAFLKCFSIYSVAVLHVSIIAEAYLHWLGNA